MLAAASVRLGCQGQYGVKLKGIGELLRQAVEATWVAAHHTKHASITHQGGRAPCGPGSGSAGTSGLQGRQGREAGQGEVVGKGGRPG